MPALPVFDAHVDSLQYALDLGHDLGTLSPGQLDLVRARRGGLGAVVFVSWVDPAYIAPERGGARARTRALLGQFHRLLERHPEQVAWAGDGAALDAARASGRIAGIPGIEGGHSVEESLDELRWFFDHGVRVLTLVWNNHLRWIRSCRGGAGPEVPDGLSAFGRDVVRTMNELGMVVDLSHAGERSFYDALEVSERPVIASHSGCSAVNAHPRNLGDDQLRALAASDGVVGIAFCVPFLDRAAGEEDERVRATDAFRAISKEMQGDERETERFLAQSAVLQRDARPLSIERVLDHVVHAAEVAGVDHVGLGSDFDGIQRRPAGLEDASCYGNLAAGLRARGLTDDEVDRILGRNMERVFRTVTGPGTRANGAPLVPLA